MGVSLVVYSVYCLLGVIKVFLYGDWKLLRGYDIAYKLHRFIDFGVPLNYFGLRTFTVSAAQIVAYAGKMGGIEERWDDSSKPAEFLGSAEEWHHVRPSSGRREREAWPSLLHSLSRDVQRIQPIIAFIFSRNFVGLETRAMQQSETPFCTSNFKTKQKTRDFHTRNREIGILLDFYWKIGTSGLNRDEWQVCITAHLKLSEKHHFNTYLSWTEIKIIPSIAFVHPSFCKLRKSTRCRSLNWNYKLIWTRIFKTVIRC